MPFDSRPSIRLRGQDAIKFGELNVGDKATKPVTCVVESVSKSTFTDENTLVLRVVDIDGVKLIGDTSPFFGTITERTIKEAVKNTEKG